MKVTLYIQAIKYTWQADFDIQINAVKFSSDADRIVINIGEDEIDVPVPEFTQSDFTTGHVEQLRKVRAKFLADSQMAVKSLDEQIESLLAIEHKQGGQNE